MKGDPLGKGDTSHQNTLAVIILPIHTPMQALGLNQKSVQVSGFRFQNLEFADT